MAVEHADALGDGELAVAILVEELLHDVEDHRRLLLPHRDVARPRACEDRAQLRRVDEAVLVLVVVENLLHELRLGRLRHDGRRTAAQAEGAATAVAQAEKVAELQVMAEMYSSAVPDVDVSKLSFDDVDYESSEMAPPFLDPDSCLVPGEPVVRVEKAPENSRRIFAGIDILASVDDVWNVRAPSWFRVYHFLLWIAIY